MVLSRPALIAILGGVLAIAAFALTRVAAPADDGAAAVPAPPASAQRADAGTERAAAPKREDGLPAGIERALARKQPFVVVFTQAGGSDDAATRAAVSQLHGIQVFGADIRRIGDYRRVVSDLGIDQAPAVVIVGRDGKASVVQGYTDAGSLAQQVEDLR